MLLMNATSNGATESTKSLHKGKWPAGKRPANKRQKQLPPDPAPTTSRDDTEAFGMASSGQRIDCIHDDGTGEDADSKAKLNILPNYHIGIHFQRLLEEYGVV